jgi:hypothetical protein
MARAAPSARASTEDFSTFHVEAQEEDDESLLDHLQTRYPADWEHEWEAGGQALRTSQGCLTAGQWLTDTQLRLSTPVGRAMLFGFDLRQELSDEVSVEHYDLTLWYLAPRGARVGWLFRPFHDKSLQDMGLLWSAGVDTAGFQVQGAFVLEDVFNNFWAFRQRRVGGLSEPYRKRPYEPALRLAWHGPRASLVLDGVWLTPSRKSIQVLYSGGAGQAYALWGARAGLRLEALVAGIRGSLRAWNKQARDGSGPEDGSPLAADYRRQWQVVLELERALGARAALRTLALYGERWERYTPTPEPRLLAAVDRAAGLSADLRMHPSLTATAGVLAARLGVDQEGPLAGRVVSYGTRTESRAYVGMQARFANVRVAATEGFELDREPYEVWFIHDKAFFQIMARF